MIDWKKEVVPAYIGSPRYAKEIAARKTRQKAEKRERVADARRLRLATDPAYRAKTQLAQKRSRFKKYNLTAEEFDALYANQDGRCAICRMPQLEDEVHIDHDHRTDKVRGLLCNLCNTGLGLFKDCPDFMTAACDYLIKVESSNCPA
jgi:Recombination endonuclease VII